MAKSAEERAAPAADERLPIEALRPQLADALAAGPVVVTSPTGSGKSTQVPRWCPGRVLVVEPRRVACRSLAQRVAQLEGGGLGEGVGYRVRDERREGAETRILFATPGVVLRLGEELSRFDTVVVDEYHERGLEVDLILALLQRRGWGRPEADGGEGAGKGLVVMSATLEGERLAGHLAGRHLHADARAYPVEERHLAEGTLLPDRRGLEERVARAVAASRRDPGDLLVFLPGKGEIAGCAALLAGDPRLEVVELHGGLSLSEQAQAFDPPPAGRRKVVLATNVAETSVTLPGVGVVVDSGLVRQTRYHRDRGFLTLVPIARDSAAQRAGRAGRTAPGVCYRLWSEAAQLEARTPPEVHRESLVPLLLAAASWGEAVEELPFFDPPREHAVQAARRELVRLDALDGVSGAVTPLGRALFGLPLDVWQGRVLVEAQRRAEADGVPELLEDAVDLVSVLAADRPLFPGGVPWEREEGELPCDAVALVRGLRGGGTAQPAVLREARATAARLRGAYGLPPATEPDRTVHRRRLALVVLAADPGAAYVVRRRGKRTAWSNGDGPEIELGRESSVSRAEGVEAVAVLATHALGLGGRDVRILATCAMPVTVEWLLQAGLGRDRLASPALEAGRVVARVERVHAGRVLAVRDEVPRGELARKAAARLFLEGRLFRHSLERTRERLEAAALAQRLGESGLGSFEAGEVRELYGGPVPSLESWVLGRLEALGLESGDDLPLLSPSDLEAPELPDRVCQELDREFPRQVELPSGLYRAEYDLAHRRVTLHRLHGRGGPPRPAYLPRFSGFTVRVRHGDALHTVRG